MYITVSTLIGKGLKSFSHLQFFAGGITLCRGQYEYVGQYLWVESGLATERRKVLESFRASSKQVRPSSTSQGALQPL